MWCLAIDEKAFGPEGTIPQLVDDLRSVAFLDLQRGKFQPGPQPVWNGRSVSRK